MSGKEFIGSIAISIIAIGVMTLFVMPQLYPVIQTGIDDTQTDISDLQSDVENIQSDIADLQAESNGIVLQIKYKEFYSPAQILDDDIGSYIPIPDTELSITVQNNSRLAVIFSGRYSIGLDDSLGHDKVAFNISMNINDSTGKLVGRRQTRISYYPDGPLSDRLEISGILYLDYVTNPLNEGTYTVSLSWISLYDQVDTTYLVLTSTPANFPRSLRLIEYAS